MALRHFKNRFACVAALATLASCSDGNVSQPAAINVPQCSGSACGAQGQPVSAPTSNAQLCPADQAISGNTYLGGAGSGEVVSLHIDATAMTYTLKWLESSVPLAAGTLTPTRKGVTISGNLTHPPAGTLPTAQQTRCAFVLMPGSSDSGYSTSNDFNQANPPTILLGFGIAGGGIPGATMEFDGYSAIATVAQNPGLQQFLGILTNANDLQTASAFLNNVIAPPFSFAGIAWALIRGGFGAVGITPDQLNMVQQVLIGLQTPAVQQTLVEVQSTLNTNPQALNSLLNSSLKIPSMIGAVPNRHVDFYPFLGFSSVSNNPADLQGTYNGLLYHVVPSGGYATSGTITHETFDKDGHCTSTNAVNTNYTSSATGCLTTGGAWAINPTGYFDSAAAPQIGTQFSALFSPSQIQATVATINGIVGGLSNQTLIGLSGIVDPAVVPVLQQTAQALGGTIPLLSALTLPKAGLIASAHMVLGQLNGATIPVIVRTGLMIPGTAPYFTNAQVDDESGIAVLSPATALKSGAIDGAYAGADSNFKYTGTVINGAAGSFIDPTSQQPESAFTLDYGQSTPGLIHLAESGNAPYQGDLITAGGLYAALIQGSANGGLASTSSGIGMGAAITPAAASPYFSVGALSGAAAQPGNP
ncbi:DUF2957 domain-containing protein [Caballeronia sp. LZ034LL]|uniref:DUF2957 domain-containing protein n=1 Tax=Caballeronia sp. LZ034LL TaxID=3038567 RepID=UPI00285627F4|nr:DUF2957 domain-containing protein [Caballeronia sp. LZ034LL]MDR5834159.1 DUF2957 domain-containing protein [Caballeronia sp. LZ034LL]